MKWRGKVNSKILEEKAGLKWEGKPTKSYMIKSL